LPALACAFAFLTLDGARNQALTRGASIADSLTALRHARMPTRFDGKNAGKTDKKRRNPEGLR